MITTTTLSTHEYKIKKINYLGTVDGNSKVIVDVNFDVKSTHVFDYTCVDGTIKNKYCVKISSYTSSLNTESISNFVQYDDLTEDQVLQWIFSSNASLKNEIETQHDLNIADQKNKLLDPSRYVYMQVSDGELPWS